MRMKREGADWPSVFTGAQSFNPFSVPIMLKMGRVKHNRINVGLRQRTLGNLELMKVHVHIEHCLQVKVRSGQYISYEPSTRAILGEYRLEVLTLGTVVLRDLYKKYQGRISPPTDPGKFGS